MIQPDNDGADHGDEHVPQIEAGDAGRAKRREHITADHSADDPEHDVHQHALAGANEDLARDEAGDQAQHDPG